MLIKTKLTPYSVFSNGVDVAINGNKKEKTSKNITYAVEMILLLNT